MMRPVLSIHCLPKMPLSLLTSTGSQIATVRRSLTRTNVETWTGIFSTVDCKNVRLTTGNSSPNLLQRDTSPHRHSQLSDLTIRLYSTTSLNFEVYITKMVTLSANVQTVYWSVQLCRSQSCDPSFFTLIGQSPQSCGMPLIWPSM